MSDTDKANSKARLRVWILRILADIEECEDVEAELTEGAGRKTILTIQFKV